MDYFEFPKDLTNFLTDPDIHQVVSLYVYVSKDQIKSRIYANSIVLACHSEVFRNLIMDGEEEIFLGDLKNRSPQKRVIKLSIDFMYGNRSAVSKANRKWLVEMYKFAKVWSIPSLQRACIQCVTEDITCDPTMTLNYYKKLGRFDWSSKEILEQLVLESIRNNSDVLIEFIMNCGNAKVKKMDDLLKKELIKSSKNTNCGKFLVFLLENNDDKKFVLENIASIPETAFSNYSDFLSFKKKFPPSETKLNDIASFYKNHQADPSTSFCREDKIEYAEDRDLEIKFQQDPCDEETKGSRTSTKDFGNEKGEENRSIKYKLSNPDQPLFYHFRIDGSRQGMQKRVHCFPRNRPADILKHSNKDMVKDNWEDDSFEDSDSQFDGEVQNSIESASTSVHIENNDPKNVLNNHIIASKNWEESISQFYDKAHDWGVSTSKDVQIVSKKEIQSLLRTPNKMTSLKSFIRTSRNYGLFTRLDMLSTSKDVQIVSEKEIQTLLRTPNMMSLKSLIKTSRNYSLFTRLDMMGLKLNNETKYGVPKLISTLSPFFEDPRTPSCMLEDFEKLAIKSVLGNQETVLSQKLKELSKKQRKPTTVITQTFPCTLFFESVRSKGQISICKDPFKELIVDFSDNHVKFSANPSKYENYILHSYVLRLYDDGCSIFNYVPILLFKVNDIQYHFETGKSSKYGSVKIVVVLSESTPANDEFYEGALVRNLLDY